MKLIITVEHHFSRTPDGTVWSQIMFAYSYWKRYLNVFDHVRIVARLRDVPSVRSDWKRADGDSVSFIALPDYRGPWQYLRQTRRIRHIARTAIEPGSAVILYPGQVAASIEPILRQMTYPYGVYVIADPYDIFAPGAVKHPLRPFFRWLFTRQSQRLCSNASAVAYITEYALQQRYPPAPESFTTYFAMGEMPQAAFVAEPRPLRLQMDRFNLIIVGSMNQLYKAQDVLIDAVAICVEQGLDLKLTLVGDGQYRPQLEAQAVTRGLKERVCFKGQLTAGEAVRTHLDQADLFVLPSRQEGLPRAMIEAMARGLPCVGSTRGGIPELLPTEDMIPPGDAIALANKIREVVTDSERMAHMSAYNLEKAENYRGAILRERRNAFYRYIQAETEAWLQSKKKNSLGWSQRYNI